MAGKYVLATEMLVLSNSNNFVQEFALVCPYAQHTLIVKTTIVQGARANLKIWQHDKMALQQEHILIQRNKLLPSQEAANYKIQVSSFSNCTALVAVEVALCWILLHKNCEIGKKLSHNLVARKILHHDKPVCWHLSNR